MKELEAAILLCASQLIWSAQLNSAAEVNNVNVIKPANINPQITSLQL
jgi:hypothetical protein